MSSRSRVETCGRTVPASGGRCPSRRGVDSAPAQCVRRSASQGGYSSGGSGSGSTPALGEHALVRPRGRRPTNAGRPSSPRTARSPRRPATSGPNAAPSGSSMWVPVGHCSSPTHSVAFDHEHDVRAEVAVAAHDHAGVVRRVEREVLRLGREREPLLADVRTRCRRRCVGPGRPATGRRRRRSAG